MAFSRPTLSELRTRVESDLSSRLIESQVPLRRAVIKVLAAVLAGLTHLMYGFLAWIADQIFPDTADSENLRRKGSYESVDPIDATFASGSATVTGDEGKPIPTDTLLQRSDGIEYRVTADATIASGTATLALTCETEGQTGNCDVGTELSFLSPIAGVSGTATATSLSGGTDAETDDAYLARLLEVKREPPQGGAEADYKKWAKEIAGVTRVWVYPNNTGPGSVGVTFVRDDDTPSVIPDSTEVAAVQAYITDPTRAPVTADVTVFAPISTLVNFTIHTVPDNADVRAAIQAELKDLIRREGAPGGTLPLSHIQEAISVAAGETDHVLTSPSADVVMATGHFPELGTFTWT